MNKNQLTAHCGTTDSASKQANSKQEGFFTTSEKELLDGAKIPRHVAIIPDGNRRWAKKNVRMVNEGHEEGAEVLVTIVKAAKELGVKVLTVFSFSTENWSRSDLEVTDLMKLYDRYLRKTVDEMQENGVRLCTIGDTKALPFFLRETLEKVKQKTAHCRDLDLVLAMNYGARNEILRAMHNILSDIESKKVSPKELLEPLFSSYLDTREWPDPDLVIRTSGEHRISNFLLWQSSYSEIYIEDAPWPSFTPHHFLSALYDFQKRQRRHGGGV